MSVAVDEKRAFWRRHVEAWRASGMSQAAYCRRHDLKGFQLHYWKTRFPVGGKGGRLRLVPIVPTAQAHPATSTAFPTSETPTDYLVVSCNGVSVKAGPKLDLDLLKNVLMVAKSL